MFFRQFGVEDRLKDAIVLHFAPESRLSTLLKAAGMREYIQADLFPSAAGIQRIDLQDTGLPSDHFDLVIANHVLEHVDDVSNALSEIYRMLVPGGAAVLQTPYSPVLCRTWEDPGLTSEQARLQAFGQEDHVRLFGQDIFSLIEASGLQPALHWHHELGSTIDPDVYGVNPEEPFFLFLKPQEAG